MEVITARVPTALVLVKVVDVSLALNSNQGEHRIGWSFVSPLAAAHVPQPSL